MSFKINKKSINNDIDKLICAHPKENIFEISFDKPLNGIHNNNINNNKYYLYNDSTESSTLNSDDINLLEIELMSYANNDHNNMDNLCNDSAESSTLNSDDINLLEIELMNHVNNNSYQDKNKKCCITKKISEEYGPFGSQWVHDEQVDDILDDILIVRSKKYDYLRAKILPIQGSKEWFEMRNKAITASDGGTVLGLNKYEPRYKFILKKCDLLPFESNKYCYHGKKFEQIATIIYEYRMNVKVDEFGLLIHPTIPFLGASPDGICNRFKHDTSHTSKYVGRMLEIKCPLTRQIIMTGSIKDNICPISYWIQVQLQLECCDLEECDFWQCNIREYINHREFIEDTDPLEPFRSKIYGFEKGCLIQLIPKKRMNEESNDHYWEIIYKDAKFIYPPKIEMTPHDCDIWTKKMLNVIKDDPEFIDFTLDKIIYWRLEKSKNVIINRDRTWFEENFKNFEKMWNYVLFFRSNIDKLDILVNYINSRTTKRTKDIMNIVDQLYDNSSPKYDDFIKSIVEEIAIGKTKVMRMKEKKKLNRLEEVNECDYMFKNLSKTSTSHKKKYSSPNYKSRKVTNYADNKLSNESMFINN
jgi:putative phage-type endonuclease